MEDFTLLTLDKLAESQLLALTLSDLVKICSSTFLTWALLLDIGGGAAVARKTHY